MITGKLIKNGNQAYITINGSAPDANGNFDNVVTTDSTQALTPEEQQRARENIGLETIYAEDVQFADGETFQEKLDAGELNGASATINGVTTLIMIEGDNITFSQIGDTLTVSLDSTTLIDELVTDNNFVVDVNYVHTDNNYTTAEKTKLAGLENFDDTEILADITALVTGKADKSDTYTKSEIDEKISSIYKYKGVKENYAEIEAITDMVIGDVWEARDTGENYAWNGTTWDDLGNNIDLTSYALKSELPTSTSDLINDSNFVVDASYVHTDNNYTTLDKDKLDSITVLTAEQIESIDEVSDKVDKIEGKSLSTNDFTNLEKTKLAGIEAGAQVNPNMTLYSTTEEVTIMISSKADDFTTGTRLSMTADRQLNVDFTEIPYSNLTGVPEAKTDLNQFTNVDGFIKESQLNNVAISGDYRVLNHRPLDLNEFTNEDGFVTSTTTNLVNYYQKSETYTRVQIDNLLSTSFTYEFVATVPTPETALPYTFYFVNVTPEGGDALYDQYILDVESDPQAVVKVGTTRIDLSQYIDTEDFETTLAEYTKTIDLSAVALSGDYNDLLNRPNISDIINDGIVENNLVNETYVANNFEPKRTTDGTAYNKNFGAGVNDVVRGNQVLTNVPVGALFTDTVYDDSGVQAALISLNEKFSNTANLVGTLADGSTITLQVVVIPTATPTPTPGEGE